LNIHCTISVVFILKKWRALFCFDFFSSYKKTQKNIFKTKMPFFQEALLGNAIYVTFDEHEVYGTT
jgi:hypothetical protein